MISRQDFVNYRKKLGFTNQEHVKDYFGAGDVVASIDMKYLDFLNNRLMDIIDKVNTVVTEEIRPKDIDLFKSETILDTFEILNKNGILPQLNNQGRRPEHVYYSWMRGYILSNYFLEALGYIFEIDSSRIDLIGDDDLKKIDTFKRSPKADLEVNLKNGQKIRLEIQCGFKGINDIKQHKVLEAKRVFKNLGIKTLAIHFDLFNGQVAFVKLNEIKENDVNWITRQQMEGQTVFAIDQNSFFWKITETPIKYKDILFN